MYQQIGFIGCGNMGSALAKAVRNGNPSATLCFADRAARMAEDLAERLSGTATDNAAIARECQLIFLGVKPQVMGELLSELAPILRQRGSGFVLVTMAAGLTMDTILQMAGGSYPVIRIMPNTAAAVGEGVLLVSSRDVVEEELTAFRRVMRRVGLVDELPETLIDAASAISGCGPAYVCLMIEALADGGVACGLPRDKAMRYAAQTMVGVGRMYLESGDHPGRMKDSVCSPGGTTIQGVRALEKGSVRSACMEAVIAAYEKTLELKGR